MSHQPELIMENHPSNSEQQSRSKQQIFTSLSLSNAFVF